MDITLSQDLSILQYTISSIGQWEDIRDHIKEACTPSLKAAGCIDLLNRTIAETDFFAESVHIFTAEVSSPLPGAAEDSIVALLPIVSFDEEYAQVGFMLTDEAFRNHGIMKKLLCNACEDLDFYLSYYCSNEADNSALFKALGGELESSHYVLSYDLSKNLKKWDPAPSIIFCQSSPESIALLSKYYSEIFGWEFADASEYVLELMSDASMQAFLITAPSPNHSDYIGMGFLSAQGDFIRLFSYGILPNHQGCGLGFLALSTLINDLCNNCLHQNTPAKALIVTVDGANRPALSLYKKAGFRENEHTDEWIFDL